MWGTLGAMLVLVALDGQIPKDAPQNVKEPMVVCMGIGHDIHHPDQKPGGVTFVMTLSDGLGWMKYVSNDPKGVYYQKGFRTDFADCYPLSPTPIAPPVVGE